MKKLLTIIFTSSLFTLSCNGGGPDNLKPIVEEPVITDPIRPFPQNKNFTLCIKPNHQSQDQLNNDVIDYYKYWKLKYVKASNGVTPGGGYYLAMKGTGGDGNEITTSEAHGYGMIVFALMAGYDKDAKQFFDGFFNMFDKHRSTTNPHLMSWVIHKTEKVSYDQGSATDGDLDIAYALLLADKQWGSDGKINYLSHAKEMINKGIKLDEMSSQTKRVLLGDWDTNQYSTRSSDWMAGHFRAFNKATNDKFWLDAIDVVYELIESITANYSSTTGLMPDFIVGSTPKPAPEYYLNEFKETDEYNWNACRYPWRITSDFAHNNNQEARKAMLKLLDFIVEKSNGDPKKIKAGYYLNGDPLNSYSDAAFTAPLVTAAIVDTKYQDFLNKGWDEIVQMRSSYFGDTIGMLNLLMISGNWWNPSE